MHQIVTVYCSGSIMKGKTDSKKLCWTDTEKVQVTQGAMPIQVRFLNPDDPSNNLHDEEAMFGRDMYQVQFADFVVVDARQRRGIGIGIEMIASRLLRTHLIVVAPRNTYYRQDRAEYRGGTVENYVHPHVALLADFIVDDFVSAGKTICHVLDKGVVPKDAQTVLSSIEAYKKRALKDDEPMKQIIASLRQKDGE